MNAQEYEQNRRECWEDVSKTILTIGGKKEKRAFDYVFDRAYALGFDVAMNHLGKHEKNAEGEEMLTCDRDVVRMLYDGTDSVKVRQVLEGIFGSKCLPDELNEDNFAKSEPKPSEPKNEGTRQEQYVPKNAESGTHSPNRILKDGFREHNRLHIAAMAMQGILANSHQEMVDMKIDKVAKLAIAAADALIAECEKGGVE